MKTGPREKREYTTTMGMENARKLPYQIFDFQSFVTEIFSFKVCNFSYFLKTSKNEIFDKFCGHIAPRSRLIGASCPQSVHFKVGFMHFDRRTLCWCGSNFEGSLRYFDW